MEFTYAATLIRVIDGDTVEVLLKADCGFKRTLAFVETLRLQGIDSPEKRGATRSAGEAARDHLSSLLAGGFTVRTVKDRDDKYGRILAKLVLPDGTLANDRMIADGHAVSYMA